MFRIAIIGVGKWGMNYVSTVEKSLYKEVEIVAISRLSKKKNLFFTSLNGNKYKLVKWNKLNNIPNLNGIIIASPPQSHRKIASYYIKQKIPILVEKPFTLNFRDTKYLLSLSIKHQSLIKVGHIFLFNETFKKLRKNLTNKSIIKIDSYGYNNGPIRDYSPLWDWGPHDLSMIFSILGFSKNLKLIEVKKISGINNREKWIIKCKVDSIIINIKIGNLYSSKKRLLKVFCKNKKVYIFKENNIRVNNKNYNSPLENQIKNFYYSTRKDNFEYKFFKKDYQLIEKIYLTLSKIESSI